MCRYEQSAKRNGTWQTQAEPNLKKTISTYTLKKKKEFSLAFKATKVQVTLTDHCQGQAFKSCLYLPLSKRGGEEGREEGRKGGREKMLFSPSYLKI